MNLLNIVFIIIIALALIGITLYLVLYKPKETPAPKEKYVADYRKADDWGNTPALLYDNGWYLNAPVGSQYCAKCEEGRATGCACNRLTADQSDPYRTRYPIDLPTPFKPYELPGQICPRCLEVIKTDLA